MSVLPLPLKVSSLQTKELHVQNKLIFSNPPIVLTGSNTALLFNRVEHLETEVADLYVNGGGGGGTAMAVYYPSLTANSFESLTAQLIYGATYPDPYDSFARFAYPSLVSPLLSETYSLPSATENTHFRISNETDLSTFPLSTFLLVETTNSNLSTNVVTLSTEVVSFRFTNGTWSTFGGT